MRPAIDSVCAALSSGACHLSNVNMGYGDLGAAQEEVTW